MKLAPGIYISEQICKTRGKTRQYFYVLLAALLTFLVYVGYHMCRVPIGIIENEETFLNCTEASVVTNTQIEPNTEKIYLVLEKV